jgi:hypothetical protein
MHFNIKGQSSLEALFSLLLITSVTSLMFHAGIKVCHYLIAEQRLAEKTLTDFSNWQSRNYENL